MSTVSKNGDRTLNKAAARMTEIIQEVLDELPEPERKKRLVSYLSKSPKADASGGKTERHL